MRWDFSPHLVFLLKESFVFVGELYTREAPPRGEWFSTLTKFYRIKDAPMLIKTFELKDPAASFYIFDFLERLGPAALKPLLEALFREENPYCAFCVKLSLMRVAPRALKELRELAIDPEEKVRAMAVRALGLSSRKEAVPALIRALDDESANVRYNAAVMLSVVPDRRAVASLADALKDSDDIVPAAAAYALGVIGDPAAIRPLQEYFCSTRPGARQGGASALAGTGEQSTQVLLTFLKDPDEETRIASACALAELRSTSTVPGLKKALSDKSEHVRSAAADALGYTGGPGVTEALKKALSDPGVGVRTCATHSLGRLKDPTAADALAAMLKDKDMRVRLAAANVLGEIGGERALEILIELLANPELAPLAVSGIKSYGASAAPALMAAMPASSVSVRCQIIGCLAETHIVEAVPLLLDGLGDPDVDIRYCANKALKMITSHETSYKCDVPEAERAKGMEEWRAWWKRHGEKK
jgi:HEAT repeat protein